MNHYSWINKGFSRTTGKNQNPGNSRKVPGDTIAKLIRAIQSKAGKPSLQDLQNYLQKLGYLGQGNSKQPMTLGAIIKALNNPALAKAIAEAYQAPAGGKRKGGAPGVTPEKVASPII